MESHFSSYTNIFVLQRKHAPRKKRYKRSPNGLKMGVSIHQKEKILKGKGLVVKIKKLIGYIQKGGLYIDTNKTTVR